MTSGDPNIYLNENMTEMTSNELTKNFVLPFRAPLVF